MIAMYIEFNTNSNAVLFIRQPLSREPDQNHSQGSPSCYLGITALGSDAQLYSSNVISVAGLRPIPILSFVRSGGSAYCLRPTSFSRRASHLAPSSTSW